ncbi:DUF159-domain-containing protein [Viridothelium virens]|uniref:DUF159-domain-containing protein n=1 Tax=Viridothelium virens TaxID=1048519 RepID=A0A6A6HJS4_VIRVR|nr:DUF159-domain-containing protein [Viridothelium virens]
MCGRYAFFSRPSEVRRRLEEEGMPSQEAPDDNEVRQTYNFAPGSFGLVYRADVPDYGAGQRERDGEAKGKDKTESEDDAMNKAAAAVEYSNMTEEEQLNKVTADAESNIHPTNYKLQAMKWGLVPFWTKRNPDYGSMMKTINCRDDSLIENKGMWNTMKHRKRCIVICEGFYEWLKKHGGKEKLPHFVKRKDGQLMCFAGLWDCTKFEDSEEKLYTYSIITTDANKQLQFLHDRMPVILNNGSDEVRTWLDPGRAEWNKELQSLLKPYQGELECYPVSKDVNKVGNNSPSFVVPLNSSENKNNIANFFGNQKKAAQTEEMESEATRQATDAVRSKESQVKHEPNDDATLNQDGGDSNAPVPAPVKPISNDTKHSSAVKREHSWSRDGDTADGAGEPLMKSQKMDDHGSIEEGDADVLQENQSEGSLEQTAGRSRRKTRSATSNLSPKGRAAKGGGERNKKITSFFTK